MTIFSDHLSADRLALSNLARAHPGRSYPSTNGYTAEWTSTCIDVARFRPTATTTETRHGLIAQDYWNERARFYQGQSTCRCFKDIDTHIMTKYHVSYRTLLNARTCYPST